MDPMVGLKDEFYPIQTCLLLKEGNKEALVWWYALVLSTEQLLDHSKSMKEFNWTMLTTAVLWTRPSLHGTSLSLTVHTAIEVHILSLRIFGLLFSLLYTQHFCRSALWLSSGVSCQTREPIQNTLNETIYSNSGG